MKITINSREVAVREGDTLIEVAAREGIAIPSLCYAKGAQHKSSCMVCAVKNLGTGQVIPSCTTLATEGMSIDTESDEVQLMRRLSLELLLSDHRADCEAPCKVACPAGLDIAAMNRLYDRGEHDSALALLRDSLVIPATLCYICSAPCEKVCRRSDVDHAVAIREIKKALVAQASPEKIQSVAGNGKKVAVLGADPAGLAAAYHLRKRGYDVTVFEKLPEILTPHIPAGQVPADIVSVEVEVLKRMGIALRCAAESPVLAGFDGVIAAVHDSPQAGWLAPSTKSKQPARLALEGCRMADKMHGLLEGRSSAAQDGKDFNATYTRFTEAEKQTQSAQLAAQPTASGCLHCDCDEKATCKLRRYAAEHGIKSSRYGKSSPTEALKWQSAGRLRFEQAKCIRCGLCVYNSRNGFTFQHRGFAMQVVLPPENVGNVTESLASLCPTGALYTAAN